jgi:hypothetical protein
MSGILLTFQCSATPGPVDPSTEYRTSTGAEKNGTKIFSLALDLHLPDS